MPFGSTAAGSQCAQTPDCSGPGFRVGLSVHGLCQFDGPPGPASPSGDLAHGSGLGWRQLVPLQPHHEFRHDP
eukprot:11592376-Prorocentrum_lima.AAC.1